MPRSCISSLAYALGLAWLVMPCGYGDGANSVFGQSQESEAALIGVMYDLKQTQSHQPTNVNAATYYTDVLDIYLGNHWDESVLDKYYRVSRPLYTTQIFIPDMNADEAPKAFGAEKTIQPSRWIIHYKGQVSPPTPGTYRFWGCSDDIIAVAVNGKTMLIATMGSADNLKKMGWAPSEPDGMPAADNRLRPGDWFTVKANEIIDLDIIIGECPGGFFNAFLMIQNQGETYAKDKDGNLILPIFQVATHDTPVLSDRLQPQFAKAPTPWKSYQ